MTPQHQLRAKIAELVAGAIAQATDPDLQLSGVSPAEISRRALLKIQIDQTARLIVTAATTMIEQAAIAFADYRINELLQDGQRTFTMDGREVYVERAGSTLKVIDTLTGASVKVSDGAFVIFIDSRCAGNDALRRWQALVNDDTKIMMIPLQIPPGSSVPEVVAARRQESAEGFVK